MEIAYLHNLKQTEAWKINNRIANNSRFNQKTEINRIMRGISRSTDENESIAADYQYSIILANKTPNQSLISQIPPKQTKIYT